MSGNHNATKPWTADKELEDKVRKLLLSKISNYKENYSKVDVKKLLFITLERSKIKSEHYMHIIDDIISSYDAY